MKISAHLMVRDGVSVLQRLVRSLRGVVTELCAVDTGSTDDTLEVLRRECVANEISFRGTAISPLSRPDLYFPDLPSSFVHSVPGTFIGRPILRDWAAARNLGLALCTGDVVLKVDADDEILEPGEVATAATVFCARPEVDVVMAPYEVADPATVGVEYVAMYARMWRNRREICFREVCHENVDWWRRSPNWVMTSGARVRDHRDSPSRGKVAHHYYKVLLREYERIVGEGREPGLHLLSYLAEEGICVDPSFSLQLCQEMIASRKIYDTRWLWTIRGECHLALGNHVDAEEELDYASSMGSRRAGLLRAMVSSKLGTPGWREVLAGALEVAGSCCYPQGATASEIQRGRQLLTEVSTEFSAGSPSGKARGS